MGKMPMPQAGGVVSESCRSRRRACGLIRKHVSPSGREIDRLVYDLYGVTEEEIAIVEGAGV